MAEDDFSDEKIHKETCWKEHDGGDLDDDGNFITVDGHEEVWIELPVDKAIRHLFKRLVYFDANGGLDPNAKKTDPNAKKIMNKIIWQAACDKFGVEKVESSLSKDRIDYTPD